MKNIYILPTDKPSRVQLKMNDTLHIENGECIALRSYQNIYITSFEEIKEGDWVYENNLNKETKIYQIKKIEGKLLFFRFKNVPIWLNKGNHSCKKIILTTDQDLIKDGVQAIDDKFLNWFIKNPNCEVVEVIDWLDDSGNIAFGEVYRYQISFPKEETKLDHIGVHLDHCYQGEYEDSCKYGDDDCPVNKIKQRAKNYMSLKDALEPKDVVLEEIAQWVINNRYSKNESSKISDSEMYNILIDKINKWCDNKNQQSINQFLIWYNETNKINR